MVKNIVSLILLIVSVLLSFKHSWDTFTYKNNPTSVKEMAALGIPESSIPFLGCFTIVVGVLLLFPKTFLYANILNAMSIMFIMFLAIRADNYNMFMIEIPFLVMPFIMMWLKYPFRNT